MHAKATLLNLIESVKNHSKLYSNLTQNVGDNDEEWTAVAKECGIPIKETQAQWNMLMNEYIEYLKNNKDFDLAEHMYFVQPHFFVINDKESFDEIELLNAIDSKNFEKTNHAYKEHINDDSKLETCSETEIDTEVQTNPTLLKNAESKTDCMLRVIPQDNSITNMSSIELIFLGYAKELQKMPTALQLKTKRKIADIMDEAELQMIS